MPVSAPVVLGEHVEYSGMSVCSVVQIPIDFNRSVASQHINSHYEKEKK